MTSAWYTNVVQTGGLTFEAESWGFEGNITLEHESVQAAPGDDGIINLTVENNGASVSAISVNVSKNAMTDAMQKRLYFYVDTRMSRNEETMDRVYLNRFEGYTYNVFHNSSLTLTEDFSNAPVIKWEWVYDVLGYYVMAKPYQMNVAAEGEPENLIQKMDITEYLRPIVYDYDRATTVTNTEGENISVELFSVDGTMAPEDFLAQLSLTDGYAGQIHPVEDYVFDGYYRVAVDDTGYGVYAYLCNYAQIQQETRYDTYLGELAHAKAKGETLTEALLNELQQSATLTLSAQNDDDMIVNVNTVGALQDVLNIGTADVIQLSSDVSLAAGMTVTIPEDRRVMIDLNGKQLTSIDGAAITAEPGSSLTLVNGTLQQGEQSGDTNPGTTYGIRAVGAEVVMNAVHIKDFVHGVYVGDNAEHNDMDSRVHIMHSEITVDNCAAFISGNGLLTDQKSRLIIEKSTLSSRNIVVAGNGDTNGNGRWGTDIQIIDSSIHGIDGGAGIYQPQKDSTLTIINSTVTGSTGIALKASSARIDHSVIVGEGDYHEPSFEGSGFSNTGDAIYIETNYGHEIYLWISNDSSMTVKDANSLQVRVYEPDAANVLVEYEEQESNETTE